MTIKLFPYQVEDIDKMLNLPGFLNANDPGTGKTYEALGELQQVWPLGNVVITCPNSVKSVWEDAIAKMLPFESVLTLDGKSKERIVDYAGGFLIVNWEALRLIPDLKFMEWDYVIADEAHRAKNRKAKMTRALKLLRTNRKRALTGTPVINRPDELWSILNWLYPELFPSYWRFFEEFVEYKVIYPYGYKEVIGVKNVEKLHKLLEPIMCRRRKVDVLPELPDKYYTTIRVDLSPKQKRAYAAMKKDSLAWLEQQPEDRPLEAPTILAQLTRLRQFASAYCFVESDSVMQDWIDVATRPSTRVQMSEPSSKLDAMMDWLSDNEEPVVIFSQFKQLIRLAEQRLIKAGIHHFTLTGDTPEKTRGTIIEGFQQSHERHVFLATIQAGGVGITLHRASTAIFLDKTWSPAQNLQAEDRLHRIGQRNAVHIINIAANDTVDQVVEEKLQRKIGWMKEILGDE